MAKEVIITRKVQLLFNTEDPAMVKQYWKLLRLWQEIVFRAANQICAHLYTLEKLKTYTYLTDEIPMRMIKNLAHFTEEKIAEKISKGIDLTKHEEGILKTSAPNATYQLVSNEYKGKIPTNILTALNSVITQTFNAEKKDYYNGSKSLRTYKSTIPIPFMAAGIRNFKKQAQYKNYTFSLFDLEFRTNFARDRSFNQIIFDQWQNKEKGYTLCDSSIQIKDKKIFLLAVFGFNKELYDVNPDIIVECHLGIETPIIAKIDGKTYSIGFKYEFLRRRLRIQETIRSLQRDLRFAKAGKGRTKKLAALERFGEYEHNYVKQKIRAYVKKLIDICLKLQVGKIILVDQIQKEAEAKEDEFLLRNWSYYSMNKFIAEKASRVGIVVEVR